MAGLFTLSAIEARSAGFKSALVREISPDEFGVFFPQSDLLFAVRDQQGNHKLYKSLATAAGFVKSCGVLTMTVEFIPS